MQAASTLGFGITVYANPSTVSFGGTTNKFYDSHRHPTSNYNYGTLRLSVGVLVKSMKICSIVLELIIMKPL